jgi:DNA polymerase-3 subunit delta
MTNRKQAYLFMGDDEYPLTTAARELVNQLVPAGEQAFGLEIIEGRSDSEDEAVAIIKRCHEALVTPGFLMVRGKLVWWRSVTFLGDVKLSANEAVKAAMKELTGALEAGRAGDATLLMTAPKLDKRSALYKLFSSRFEIREFMLPEKAYQVEQMAREKIPRALKDRGITADADALELMQARVGADSRLIEMEAEKLALFLGERRRATRQDVQAVVSATPTSAMWDLQDAVGERNLKEALEIVGEFLAGKENPIGMVISLMNRMRDLMLYREALDQGWLRIGGRQAEWGGMPEESEALLAAVFKRDPRSIHPFVVGKMAGQARLYTAAELRRNQRLLMEAHESLVSSRVSGQTVLELTLVRLTR